MAKTKKVMIGIIYLKLHLFETAKLGLVITASKCTIKSIYIQNMDRLILPDLEKVTDLKTNHHYSHKRRKKSNHGLLEVILH